MSKLARAIWNQHKDTIDSFDLTCTNGHKYEDERDCQALFHALVTLKRMKPTKDVIEARNYLLKSKHYSVSNEDAEY